MIYDADSLETATPPPAGPIDVSLENGIDLLPVAIVDDAGRIRHWSSGCTALYGWSAADAVGALKYVLMRSSTSGLPAIWAPPPPGAPARSFEEIHRDGHRIHVLEQVIPLETEGYILCMIQDGAAIARVDDDSVRVALALSMNAIGTFSFDIPTRRLEWSQHFWRPLGVGRGNLSLAQIEADGLGAATGQIVTLFRDALANGSGHVEAEMPIRGTTFGDRTLRFQARLMRNALGIAERFVGVMQDLTDADVRERTLRDREAELNAILEKVSDAMVVIDGEGAIGAFSRAAQELLGYDSIAMIGKPIDPLVEGGWPAIIAAAEHGGARELWVSGAAGHRLPIELRVGSLPGNTASGHILFLTDISERKAKEARRNTFEHAARDIAMAEFAVHLMHELNQPLAAASNFLAVAQQLATEPDRVPAASEMIDLALGQIQRLGGIIRSAQRKVIGEDMDPRSVLVRAEIDEAVALVRSVHGNSDVDIAIEVHPEAQTMFVDPIGIQQVLANLLRNAIEAFGPTPRQGARIEVRSQRADPRLLLSVCDNGPGIAPMEMADLFEPFRRSAKKTGMGLGLSICRTIAEAHGGTLSAHNLPAGGACFTLALPLHDRDEVA